MIEMEYVVGGRLKNLFELETPLKDAEVAKIMKSLLLGVEHIHSKNIVHRDLKPENILLTHGRSSVDDQSVCTSVKIIDFGISAELKGNGPAGSLISERAGTLLYMAPE